MERKKNVYIATLPRSGSTLLGMMLGNHPECCHIGESSYWRKTSPQEVRCSCGRIGCAILTAVHEKAKANNDISAIYEVCSAIDRKEEPEKVYHRLSLPSSEDVTDNFDPVTLKRMINRSISGLKFLAEVFRDVSGRSVIVDNTKNMEIADALACRQDWRLILMTRDPRGIAFSGKKSGERKGVPRPVEMKIPVFINFARKAISLSESERVSQLRYEDLCGNPHLSLKKICAFLDIPFDPLMLRFKRDRGHLLMGNRMRFDDNEKILPDLGWRDGLKKSERSLIEDNEELTFLYGKIGYDLADDGEIRDG